MFGKHLGTPRTRIYNHDENYRNKKTKNMTRGTVKRWFSFRGNGSIDADGQ